MTEAVVRGRKGGRPALLKHHARRDRIVPPSPVCMGAACERSWCLRADCSSSRRTAYQPTDSLWRGFNWVPLGNGIPKISGADFPALTPSTALLTVRS